MQTLVLVIADRSLRGLRPLSTASASGVPALEGTLVICVVGITVMSGLLPATAAVGPLGVGSIAIFVVWLVGMLALGRCRDRKDMHLAVPADTSAQPALSAADSPEKGDGLHNASTARNVTIFLAASVVTLVAGVVLEQSGDRLADLMGINGVLFGATVLALASALPEISTAITGVKMKTYTLVFGDIFDSNAFQLILFVPADLLAGQPVLPHEGRANAWIGTIGLVMTAVYVAGILLRKPRRYWGLRADSWAVLLIYVLGSWGFVLVSRQARRLRSVTSAAITPGYCASSNSEKPDKSACAKAMRGWRKPASFSRGPYQRMPGTGRRRDGHQPWRLSQESSSRAISAVVPLHCLRHAGEADRRPRMR
jgi:cation:H+ antiporter